MTARITYQDSRVTEYEDGTEEVHFSDNEYNVMARSPRYFGLCLPCGHSNSHYDPCEGCNACFCLAETDPEDREAAEASFPRAPADEVSR